eukprot:9251-Heterococcus_DN1.PRE.2
MVSWWCWLLSQVSSTEAACAFIVHDGPVICAAVLDTIAMYCTVALLTSCTMYARAYAGCLFTAVPLTTPLYYCYCLTEHVDGSSSVQSSCVLAELLRAADGRDH